MWNTRLLDTSISGKQSQLRDRWYSSCNSLGRLFSKNLGIVAGHRQAPGESFNAKRVPPGTVSSCTAVYIFVQVSLFNRNRNRRRGKSYSVWNRVLIAVWYTTWVIFCTTAYVSTALHVISWTTLRLIHACRTGIHYTKRHWWFLSVDAPRESPQSLCPQCHVIGEVLSQKPKCSHYKCRSHTRSHNPSLNIRMVCLSNNGQILAGGRTTSRRRQLQTT